QKVDPEFAIADTDYYVGGAKAKPAQEIDAECDGFDVGVERSVADNVSVELEMFSKAAALLFFVAETLRDGKPLERFFEFAVMRRDDPGEGGRQLGPQRDFACALVGEVEQLTDDLRTAFFRVKLGRFQDGSVPFDKAVTARDFTPFREDVISHCALARQEITETGKWLHP